VHIEVGDTAELIAQMRALDLVLAAAGFEIVSRSVIPDGVASVAGELARVCAEFAGLVVTTGGTGFAPRDHGTRSATPPRRRGRGHRRRRRGRGVGVPGPVPDAPPDRATVRRAQDGLGEDIRIDVDAAPP
jgi:hypothetical protein